MILEALFMFLVMATAAFVAMAALSLAVWFAIFLVRYFWWVGVLMIIAGVLT